MTVALKLTNINKSFVDVTALSNIHLEINDGEFFSLLGPSGSGKTTCLKAIAGFELPDTGQIELFGKDVSSIPPFKRDVNTVFQDYALFPHMNVKDNVAYSLKIKKIPANQQEHLISEILSTVKLLGYETRKPSELSGGQRQRVALARSLINKPKVLLLDEPLGALDLKLREQMQFELKSLQRQFEITFVYVTHDQQEAMSMSDRIAIFNEGRIEQIDTPINIYNKPKSAFVADFIGETNLIDVNVSNLEAGKGSCILPGGEKITCSAARGARSGPGHLSVRPERIKISASSKSLLKGTAVRHIYLGTDLHIEVKLNTGSNVTVRMQNSTQIQIPDVGQSVGLDFDPSSARLLVD